MLHLFRLLVNIAGIKMIEELLFYHRFMEWSGEMLIVTEKKL